MNWISDYLKAYKELRRDRPEGEIRDLIHRGDFRRLSELSRENGYCGTEGLVKKSNTSKPGRLSSALMAFSFARALRLQRELSNDMFTDVDDRTKLKPDFVEEKKRPVVLFPVTINKNTVRVTEETKKDA